MADHSKGLAGRIDALGDALAAVGVHLQQRPVQEHAQLRGSPAARLNGPSWAVTVRSLAGSVGPEAGR